MKLIFDKHPGPLFSVDGKHYWNKTHAQVPVVLELDETTARVFYASRDSGNVSRISFFDINTTSFEVVYIHQEPILHPGPLGSFDDSGVMPTCVLLVDDEIWLYFVGWVTRKSVPYQNSIGLAVSKDGVHFERKVAGPVLGTSPCDPYFVGTAWIDFRGSGDFVAYYLSCNGWQIRNEVPEATYDVKVAVSRDGVNWDRDGRVAIDNDENDEAVASASVFKKGRFSYLLYCSRNLDDYRDSKTAGYRIKFAISEDSEKWEKDSSARFVDPGESGEWDENMQAYPYVVRIRDKILMFYNGNGFGLSGIGYGEIRFPE